MPSTGYGAQGSDVFFLSFFKIIFHLLLPEANCWAKDGFLSSLDAIVLSVFEKVILVFFHRSTRRFDRLKQGNLH